MRQVYKKCDACNGGYVQQVDFGDDTAAVGWNLSLCTECGGKGYIETDLFVEDNPTDDWGLTYTTPCKDLSHELPGYNGNLLPKDLDSKEKLP